jgi:hypothetical protein
MAFPPRIAAGSKKDFKTDQSGSEGIERGQPLPRPQEAANEAALTPDDWNGVALWTHPHCVQMAPWSFV